MSVEDDATVEMPAGDAAVDMPAGERERRPPPKGARCDVCHERGARVRRTSDGLLAVCAACARGVDVSVLDSTEAIAALVPRAPAGERRVLARRLIARRAMHTARRERRVRLPSTAGDQARAAPVTDTVRTDTTSGATPE